MLANSEMMELWPGKDSPESTLTRLVRQNDDGLPRPAMLVVPGGGYYDVCRSTEGVPIAERFHALGFRAFILNYRCRAANGHPYPQPQQDILRAIKLIRAHAAEWGVIPENVAAVGFSAGGHLVASAGLFHAIVDASAGDAADAFSGRPDAEVLCYPVITFVGPCHIGSCQNLCGMESYEARREEFSLELRVDKDTPPAFLWHTATDTCVPYQNTTLYAEALRRNGVACEEHIFPFGPHGMQLGYGKDELAHWPEQARRFMQEACGFRFPRRREAQRTVILTFDDAVPSQLEIAVPILQKYGFGATFFPTRFRDTFLDEFPGQLLTFEELAVLHRMGFEIGNHTWHHVNMDQTEDAVNEEELIRLNRALLDAGIPMPTSFAYPGGFCKEERQAALLNRLAFTCARTTERRAWNPDKDDRFHVPACCMVDENTADFEANVEMAQPGSPVVLVYHGVPDIAHPWCNISPENFARQMEYLHQHGFQVCSFRQYDER